MFKQIMVWRRLSSSTALRYTCLENIITGKFAVQSGDYFHWPPNDMAIKNFDKQFVELFIEIDPDERCDWFNTLGEAIEDMNVNFGS